MPHPKRGKDIFPMRAGDRFGLVAFPGEQEKKEVSHGKDIRQGAKAQGPVIFMHLRGRKASCCKKRFVLNRGGKTILQTGPGGSEIYQGCLQARIFQISFQKTLPS